MKPIPGFPCYFVDENGVIWTTKRKGGNARAAGQTGPPRKLAINKSARGYCLVSLCVNGRTVTRAVHRLVLETFVGPKPAGMEGCHYPDPDKNNNRPDNLRWDTHAENAKDAYRCRPQQTTKQCRTCQVVKPKSKFYRDKRSSDGLKGQCKQCHIAMAITTRDPENKRLRNREYMRRIRAAKPGVGGP